MSGKSITALCVTVIASWLSIACAGENQNYTTSSSSLQALLKSVSILPFSIPIGPEGAFSPGVSTATSTDKRSGQIVRRTRRTWDNDKIQNMTSPEELGANEIVMEDINNNLMTGEISIDRYRLHSHPITRYTPEYVILNTYNYNSIWQESRIFRNIGTLQHPVQGELLWQYQTKLPNEIKDLSSVGYQYKAIVADKRQGLTVYVGFDNKNRFRKTFEEYEISQKGKQILVRKQYSYNPDFFAGHIPSRITLLLNGKVTTVMNTNEYLPSEGTIVLEIKHPTKHNGQKVIRQELFIHKNN